MIVEDVVDNYQVFETSNNITWREGRWTGGDNHVLHGHYRVWNKINSVTVVIDEQNTLSLCPTEVPVNLVVVRITCLFPTKATSHVSSYLWTFRCLVGHVCQRCGPVSWKTTGTIVDVSQVKIDHTIICKIQTSRLTTRVSNVMGTWTGVG